MRLRNKKYMQELLRSFKEIFGDKFLEYFDK